MVMLTEKVLKEKFEVWGKFEVLNLEGNQVLTRPEARIVRRGSEHTINSGNKRADAVIVMLNPGSCLPIEEEPFGDWNNAKADKTQYQLMRLMERLAWNELVILNLSDLCEGNQKRFFAMMDKCKEIGIPHSRFGKNTESHWTNIISSADYLLYGWGEKPRANKLASEFGLLNLESMEASHGKLPTAVWHPERKYPKHPYPRIPQRCEAWLEDMVGVLNR